MMRILLTAGVALAALSAGADHHADDHHHDEHREALREGHMDLLVVYEADEGLHMAIAAGEHDHGHEHGEEHADEGHEHDHGHDHHDHLKLDNVEIVGGPKAVQVVTAGAAWSFLGEPGEYTYILPQGEIPGLPFLGLNTEELESAQFPSGPTLTLTSVDGPGDFALYQVDAFGQPIVFMNSADAEADSTVLPLGTHIHLNWAFTEPGEYALTFEASATMTGGTLVASGPQVVQFHIVGQPTYLHEGHADIGLHYEADHGLHFYVAGEHEHGHGHGGKEHSDHEEEHDHGAEMHPADVVLLLGGYAVAEVPDNPAYAFLGAPGSEVFLISQQFVEGVPFAGWSTEELDPADFTGEVSFELHGVEGPADVYLYEVNSSGTVNVIWDSADPAEDILTLAAGVHRHYNLAVTEAGTYELEIHAEATLAAGGNAHAHAVITLQAGGMEGYFGHFERPTPHWIKADTGGYLYTAEWPWLWSTQQGWVYAFGHGGPDHFYFRGSDGTWLWTSPSWFPWYWSYGGMGAMLWNEAD